MFDHSFRKSEALLQRSRHLLQKLQLMVLWQWKKFIEIRNWTGLTVTHRTCIYKSRFNLQHSWVVLWWKYKVFLGCLHLANASWTPAIYYSLRCVLHAFDYLLCVFIRHLDLDAWSPKVEGDLDPPSFLPHMDPLPLSSIQNRMW